MIASGVGLERPDGESVPPPDDVQIGATRWTDSQITVTGIKGIGGLVEVRLSNEVTEGDSSPTPEKRR